METLPPGKIKVSDRQRSDLGDLTELKRSISEHGILHPIIVQKRGKSVHLIAGHRRLQSALDLQLSEVPIRYFNELTPIEAKIIELDENIQRKNLSWQEECLAVLELHESYAKMNGEDWTQEQTVERTGYSSNYISSHIIAGRAIREGDDQISKASGINAAKNIISRRHTRAVDSGLQLLEEIEKKTKTKAKPGVQPEIDPGAEQQPEIFCQSFLDWAPGYSGPRFNFIHCDFPYGVNMQKSQQGGRDRHDTYEDTPDVYWALVKALCEHTEILAHSSAHMMFWFSMNYYEATREALTSAGWHVDPFPLLWHKSDNRGILPDPTRKPRRTYETALFCSRSERPIVKPVANSYSAPTTKAEHMSEKPEPVLRHFFQLFIDHTSTVLDPTCGSGSALAVADELRAERVLGMDINQEHVDASQRRLRTSRNLRSLRNSGQADVGDREPEDQTEDGNNPT